MSRPYHGRLGLVGPPWFHGLYMNPLYKAHFKKSANSEKISHVHILCLHTKFWEKDFFVWHV
jgi:hypothetical protein